MGYQGAAHWIVAAITHRDRQTETTHRLSERTACLYHKQAGYVVLSEQPPYGCLRAKPTVLADI